MAFATPAALRNDITDLAPIEPRRAALAWHDLSEGFARSWMWIALAIQDIKLRYRGSVLGPFWLTISTLVMAGGMGIVYAQVFSMDVATYLPYLTMGLILWQLLAALVNEGCEVFVAAQSVIQQVPVPFSIHVFRSVCRNFLVLAHSLLIVPIGIVAFRVSVDWHVLEIIPGFLLLAINGVWVTFALGVFGTRFRDIPPIVANFMQVLFFLTPVMYSVDALKEWRPIATYNPFFAAIDVIRAPLLGGVPAETSWIVLLAWTVVGSAFGFALFARFRARIAYWI
jgi:ABC-2 type transport system permease protein/lipopolysaccharide transport system permease protein